MHYRGYTGFISSVYIGVILGQWTRKYGNCREYRDDMDTGVVLGSWKRNWKLHSPKLTWKPI